MKTLSSNLINYYYSLHNTNIKNKVETKLGKIKK